MKRHSRNTLVSLTALALSATVLLTGCSEDAAGSTAETASAPAAPAQSSDTTATGATAAQTSELLASLTHEEMEELISGSTTLAALEKHFNLPSSGTSDAATVSPEDAAAAQAPSASSTSASPAEAPSSYDVELQALINQLYAVKANAESGLNSAIQSAKDEYHALPVDKQTATRKVSIVMGKSSELQKLEADCDKQVDAIVEKMRTLLQENGQSTELADQVKASYKAQKSAMYASLKSQLLG
mgnify:CR=1 FL=1